MGNRYWNLWLVDAWNNIPQTLGTRIGSKGGDFVLVGPNWKEPIPAGLTQLRMPTALAMLFNRMFTADRSDMNAVHSLQDQFKLVPLSKWRTTTPPTDQPSPGDVNAGLPAQEQPLAMSPEAFFGRLNALLVENPPEPGDLAITSRVARLGVRPGAKFDFAALSPDVQKAIQEGIAAGKRDMQNVDIGSPVNQWRYALDIGRFGSNYPYRAYRTFLGAGGTLAEDAIDPSTNRDADGRPFDGANRYLLKFNREQLPPASFLWSVTLYNEEGLFVANSVDRHAIQSRGGLRFGSDGSLSILIQSDPPRPDPSLNWLPAPTKGGFSLVMRLYGPSKTVLDGTWKPPAVQRAPSN
jgi:hypothetical protein